MLPENAANMTLAEISAQDPGLAQRMAKERLAARVFYGYRSVLLAGGLDGLKTYIANSGEPEITGINSLQELSARVIRSALLDVSRISIDAKELELPLPSHRQIQPSFLSDDGQAVDDELKRLLSLTINNPTSSDLDYMDFLFYLRSLSRETYKDDPIQPIFRRAVFNGNTEAARWALKVGGGGPEVEQIISEVRKEALEIGNFTATNTLVEIGVSKLTLEEKNLGLRRAMWPRASIDNISGWIQFGGCIDDNFLFLEAKLRVVATGSWEVTEDNKVLAGFYPQGKLSQNLMAAVSDNDLTQAKQWQLLGGKAATSETEDRIEDHYRNNPLSKLELVLRNNC